MKKSLEMVNDHIRYVENQERTVGFVTMKAVKMMLMQIKKEIENEKE